MRRGTAWLAAVLVMACSGDAPTRVIDAEALGFDRTAETQALISAAQYRLTLTGGEEVPPSGSPAYGVFFVHVAADRPVVEVIGRIWNVGCETIVAGHIHNAEPGKNGPVVVGLFSGRITPPVETFRARAEISEQLAENLRVRPEMHYINFHSTLTPSGFIRGQLGRTYPEPNPPGVPERC